jgi:serine/threonine-protein phosphatase 2A regulatory subunit B''
MLNITRPKQSAKRVYNTFCALDEDGNGALSRDEFSAISNGSMSALFIQVRVYIV